MNTAGTPRRLTFQWTALLLAPVAWSVALGILFSLAGEACARHTNTFHWIAIAACTLAAALCVPLAWRELRAQQQANTPVSSSVDRARCLMQVALGLGGFFTLVLLVTAIPIALLSPCRT